MSSRRVRCALGPILRLDLRLVRAPQFLRLVGQPGGELGGVGGTEVPYDDLPLVGRQVLQLTASR
jgi:hypothetical protein